MNLSWDDLQLFLAVAEARSMGKAAARLRIGQPTVSRRLAVLEEQLGEPLFRRSATGVEPTQAAERLLEPARRMAEWAGEAERAAARSEQGLAGVVRIAAPPGVAFDFLAPFAADLKRQQPGLQLEVLSAIHYLELTRGEADLALRMRPAEQPELTTLATLKHGYAAFAAPSLIARLPRGYGMAEVPWIAWAPPYEQLAPNPQLAAAIPGFRPTFTSDQFVVQLRAAEAGLGAMVLSTSRHRFSGEPKLEQLALPLGAGAGSALHLVAARSAMAVPRIRAVADALMREMAWSPATAAPEGRRRSADGRGRAR